MRAPFDSHGNLQHYPSSEWVDNPNHPGNRKPQGPEWRDQEPFQATLMFEGFVRGRSGAYFEWSNIAGEVFPMCLTDMSDLVTNDVIEYGVVRDTEWCIVKRGQNYGIRRHES